MGVTIPPSKDGENEPFALLRAAGFAPRGSTQNIISPSKRTGCVRREPAWQQATCILL